MKSRVKFIPLIGALILLMSLTLTLPALAITLGSVTFVTSATSATAIAWGNTTSALDILVADGDLGTLDTVQVKVTSSSDPTGFTFATDNCDANGACRAVITLGEDTSAASDPTDGVLKVVDGDTVNVQYTDASPVFTVADIVTVEETGPTIANLSPSHLSLSKATTHIFTADITDAASGVDTTSIRFIVGVSDDDLESDVLGGTELTPTLFTDIKDTDGVTVIGKTVSFTLGLGTGATLWTIKATDKAGNEEVYDRDLVREGVQNNLITVDTIAPVYASAKTGDYYDSTIDTDAPEKGNISAKDKKNTLSVTFSEQNDIDDATVDVTDFLVDGVQPTAAVSYPSSEVPNVVFLTMANDFGPTDKPKVQLVGALSDQAGNRAVTAEKTATDGLQPTFTIEVTGVTSSRPLSDDEITIRVTSNEALSAAGPTVIISTLKVGADDKTIIEEDATRPFTTVLAVSGLTNTWEVTVKKSDTIIGATAGEGLRNVRVTGTDRNGQPGSGGDTDPVSVSSTTLAYLYELDTKVNKGNAPAVTVTPASGTDAATGYQKTDSTIPFIRIDFNDEGVEYEIATETTGGVAAATDTDTHDNITLTKLTLDGVDMLASVSNVDDNSFIFATSDLALGTHEVIVRASDEAGNTLTTDQKSNFIVVAKEPYKVALSPGWNLVSLPGDPVGTDINSVIPATLPVDSVLTYDPASLEGPWLSAVRDPDTNLLVGGLATITSNRAYWVHTTTFAPISVEIPGLAGGAQLFPPSIPVVVGWNMTPVTTLDLSVKTFDADDYFSSISWGRAYGFNTTNNAFSAIAPAATTTGQTNITVGQGYWVWVTEAGTLAP